MRQQIKAIKEAILNALNIRKIIDYHVSKQIKIQRIAENARTRISSGIHERHDRPKEIIVSLTTYSKRIYQVHLVIESLLEQNLQADKIILWLDKDEFKSVDELPINLRRLMQYGLEIGFCDNLRSYKKLVPTLKKYPEAIIITTDDDIIYPEDFVERLYRAYLIDSSKIYFYRGHRMKVSDDNVEAYKNWDLEVEMKQSSLFNFPTGCGGVLYTCELIDKEVLNEEVFMKIAPTADDVWFKAMTLKKGILCEQIRLESPFRDKFIFLDAMDDMGLAKYNLVQNKNDEQICAVFKKYNLIQKLNFVNRDN